MKLLEYRNRSIYPTFTENCIDIKLREPPLNLLNFEKGKTYFYITERKSDNFPYCVSVVGRQS
jgi:hypothetical protein